MEGGVRLERGADQREEAEVNREENRKQLVPANRGNSRFEQTRQFAQLRIGEHLRADGMEDTCNLRMEFFRESSGSAGSRE
jgi:hypothetical protein